MSPGINYFYRREVPRVKITVALATQTTKKWSLVIVGSVKKRTEYINFSTFCVQFCVHKCLDFIAF